MPYLQEVPFACGPVHQSVSYKASHEKLKSSNSRLPKAKSRENAPLSSLPMLKKSTVAVDAKQREIERLISQIDAQDLSIQTYKQQIIYNKTKVRQRILLPRGAETASKQAATKKTGQPGSKGKVSRKKSRPGPSNGGELCRSFDKSVDGPLVESRAFCPGYDGLAAESSSKEAATTGISAAPSRGVDSLRHAGFKARSEAFDFMAAREASGKPGTSPQPPDSSMSAGAKDSDSVHASPKKLFTPSHKEQKGPHSLPGDSDEPDASQHIASSEYALGNCYKVDAGTPVVAKPVPHFEPLDDSGRHQQRTHKTKITSLDPPIKMYNYFEKSVLQQDTESGLKYAQQLSKKTAKSIIASFKAKNRVAEPQCAALDRSQDSMPSLEVPSSVLKPAEEWSEYFRKEKKYHSKNSQYPMGTLQKAADSSFSLQKAPAAYQSSL